MSKIDFIIKDKEKYNFSLDIKRVYPEVKSLEVTPSKETQIHKPDNCYGYKEVIVKPIPDEYVIKEDLLDELNTYNTELTEQQNLLNNIIEALNNRK